MPLGTTAAVLLGLGAAGAGVAVSKLAQPKQPMSSPIPLPQPPSPEDTAAKAGDIANKRRAAATQSVYTSPLGIQGQADVAKKTLLGQ